jgi:hypothetical protein
VCIAKAAIVKAVCRKSVWKKEAREVDSGLNLYICSTQALGNRFTGCTDPDFRRDSK